MQCEIPGRDGKPRTGTWRGYQAHRKVGEQACADCLAAAARRQQNRRDREQEREYRRERRQTDPEYRQKVNRKRAERRLARYRSDPEYRERERQRRRKYPGRRRSK